MRCCPQLLFLSLCVYSCSTLIGSQSVSNKKLQCSPAHKKSLQVLTHTTELHITILPPPFSPTATKLSLSLPRHVYFFPSLQHFRVFPPPKSFPFLSLSLFLSRLTTNCSIERRCCRQCRAARRSTTKQPRVLTHKNNIFIIKLDRNRVDKSSSSSSPSKGAGLGKKRSDNNVCLSSYLYLLTIGSDRKQKKQQKIISTVPHRETWTFEHGELR